MDRSDKKGNKRKRLQGRGWGGGREKEKRKRKKIQKNLQNKSKYKNNKVFLESLLSESFPTLGISVDLTSLGCPPTLY